MAKTLRLMQKKGSDCKSRDAKPNYSLVTYRPLAKDVAIGQYLGRLTFEPVAKELRSKNEGYRFHMHRESEAWGRHTVCINAKEFGSILRFCNHSCTPNAKFHAVSCGRRRTVIVVTLRVIKTGEEVTVDYGEELWFNCRCQTCKRDSNDQDDNDGSEEDDSEVGENDEIEEDDSEVGDNDESEENVSEDEESEDEGSEGDEDNKASESGQE